MNSQELLKEYLSGLKEETNQHAPDTEVLFNFMNDFQQMIENEVFEVEGDSFLDSLNLFEDVLDSKILTSQ